MTPEVFFTAVTVLYFITHLYLLSGLIKSINLEKKKPLVMPRVSIIVAARNEAKIIKDCILSLSKLNYPKDLLEIILVNDNSTDNTFEVMTESTKDFSFFKVINSNKSSNNKLKGKANAIDTAISLSSGEFILSTDADCVVPENWALETVKYFSEPTAMVCGFTKIKISGSLFSKLQSLDWMYLLTLASASSGLKKILSCLGNNLSFSKKAYNEIGGYAAINFSVTEDLALMRRMDSHKQFEIKYPVDKECLIETLPCYSLKELMSQKRRWFRGGLGINFLGYIIGAQLYLLNILLIFGLFFLSIKVYLVLIVVKIISELILISNVLNRFGLQSLYKYYPLFCMYFAFYGLILPLSFLLSRSIKWKEQKF